MILVILACIVSGYAIGMAIVRAIRAMSYGEYRHVGRSVVLSSRVCGFERKRQTVRSW